MNNMTNITPATAESFWAAMQALTEKQAETDHKMAENARQQEENARQMVETGRKKSETERYLDEAARHLAEAGRIVEENSRQITMLEEESGGLSSNQGFAEEYFMVYQNHKVYLGVSSKIFDEEIETKCKENGIAVIKQVGDMVVIHDDNLKTF